MQSKPAWSVLLLGGASGVGKTSISYELARHYNVGLTEIDDFQVILERMTSPDRYPVLHFWRDHHEEAREMSPERHLAFFIRYSKVMAEALELVMANHIETRTPVVLEGDFILPAIATKSSYEDVTADGHVRSVFLHEEDEGQIVRNYGMREGSAQLERAHTSWLVSEWLRKEAARCGLPSVPSRPWSTTLDRVISAVDSQDP